MPFKPVNYLPYDFANRRHIGPSKSEINDMLKVIGCESINDLIQETVPEDILQKETLNWGKPKSEREALYHLRVTAAKNKVLTSDKYNNRVALKDMRITEESSARYLIKKG